MTKETHRLLCPVCQSAIYFSFGYEINFFSYECERVEHKPSLIPSDDNLDCKAYKPDLPLSSWFSGFFPGLDGEGNIVGFLDGRVLLFRPDLPASLYINTERKAVTLPDTLMKVPDGAVKVWPQTVHGPIRVKMAAEKAGEDFDDCFVSRPALDLAFWICAEARFYIGGSPFSSVYATRPDGSLFMVIAPFRYGETQ